MTIHRVGGPTYDARSKPQYISAFATRVLQSTYVYVKRERESLSPKFKTFQDPRHQFHKIGRLVSGTLYILAIPALLHIQAELIPWKFLHFLKFKNSGSGELCMSDTSHFH